MNTQNQIKSGQSNCARGKVLLCIPFPALFGDKMEIWKDIEGYKGYYQVSNKGRVKGLRRLTNGRNNKPKINKERLLKLAPDKYGYKMVHLSKYGVNKTFKAHHLVLNTFDRKRKPGEECRHLNGIRDDNDLTNLKWGTQKENKQDMFMHETTTRGEKHPNSKLKETDVWLIKVLLSSKAFQQPKIAKMFNVNHATISNINVGITWRWLNEKLSRKIGNC